MPLKYFFRVLDKCSLKYTYFVTLPKCFRAEVEGADRYLVTRLNPPLKLYNYKNKIIKIKL